MTRLFGVAVAVAAAKTATIDKQLRGSPFVSHFVFSYEPQLSN